MTRLSSDRSFIHAIVKECENDIIAGLIFNRIDWSVDDHRTKNQTKYFFDGKWWMHDDIESFHAALDYCSERSIKRSLATLKEKNLIFHCRKRGKNWLQTNFYTINYDQYKFITFQIGTLTPSLVYSFDSIEKLRVQFGILAYVFDLAEKAKVPICQKLRFQFVPIVGSNLSPPSLSFSPPIQSESFNPIKEGGNARAREEKENPPPLDNLIKFSDLKKELSPKEIEALESMESHLSQWEKTLLKELEKGESADSFEIEYLENNIKECKDEISNIKSGNSYYSNKNLPPEALEELEVVWHRYVLEMKLSVEHPLSKFRDAIVEILAKTGISMGSLTAVFSDIKKGKDPLVTERFIFPWQWANKWKRGEELTFLDIAISSTNAKKKRNYY